MSDIPPEISILIKDIKDLKHQTENLQNTASNIEKGQEELIQNIKNQERILNMIKQLTNELNQTVEKQNNNNRTVLENQLKLLNEVELLKADTAIIKKKLEIQELEKHKEQILKVRIQKLTSAFKSLINAIRYVSTNEDYFNKFVWLNYFNNTLSVTDLNPDELPSLTDWELATNSKENFKQELLKSQQLLTESDKQDIDNSRKLKISIPVDKLEFNKMEDNIKKEKQYLIIIESKLEKINTMVGYSEKNLYRLKIGGGVFITLGILSFIFAFVLKVKGIQLNNVHFLIEIIVLIAGSSFLWLRYKNDKVNRLIDTTEKRNRMINMHLKHDNIYKTLESKILIDKKELDIIFTRHPVLKIVN